MEALLQQIEELKKLQTSGRNSWNSQNKITYDCEICQDKEFIVVHKDDREYYRNCQCVINKRNEERLKKSGIANISKYTFKNYITTENWQDEIKIKAKKYIDTYNTEDIKSWFFIGGQVGAGKTHICVTIMVNISVKNNLNYQYLEFTSFLTQLKQTKYDNKELYNHLIEKYKTISILYMDDFFRTEVTKADIDLLFEIINYRYINNKATIFSSQNQLAELISIDEALFSRIFEKCKKFKIDVEHNITKNYRFK